MNREENIDYINSIHDTYIKELQKQDKDFKELQQENQELKKQLEENKHKGLYNTCLPYSTGYNKAIKEKENQQKDFIKYLEDEFTKIQNDIEKEIDNNVKYFKVERRQAIAKILQKYKEIIGGKE